MAPLAGEDMVTVVCDEEAPVVGQVDPVNEHLIIDLASDLDWWCGNGPAPGPLASKFASGVAGDLGLGELAKEVRQEDREGC